jgi:hypothetical protein
MRDRFDLNNIQRLGSFFLAILTVWRVAPLIIAVVFMDDGAGAVCASAVPATDSVAAIARSPAIRFNFVAVIISCSFLSSDSLQKSDLAASVDRAQLEPETFRTN